MSWETVAQVLVIFAAASGYMWLNDREPRRGAPPLSRRGTRRLNAKDDPFAVWAAWDPGCSGWVLAHPEDERSARWMHPEDIHPICGELLSTEKRRAAWAAGATYQLPSADA